MRCAPLPHRRTDRSHGAGVCSLRASRRQMLIFVNVVALSDKVRGVEGMVRPACADGVVGYKTWRSQSGRVILTFILHIPSIAFVFGMEVW